MKALLRTYTLLLAINLSFCYNIPPADFVIYPKGFSISIPDEPGIEIFFFYGSVNKVTCAFQMDSIIMSTSKCNGEKWVLENNDITLTPGQVIYYWLYVKKDGIGYRQDSNFYNVTEILPLETPDVFEEADTINLHVTEVTTKTRLNLDPYHVKNKKPASPVIPDIVKRGPFDNSLPFTQKPNINLHPIKPPILNLDPFQAPVTSRIPFNTDFGKLPFSKTTPLNLDPGYVRNRTLTTGRPVLHSFTPPPYNNNVLSTSGPFKTKECSPVLEEETGNEPVPLPLETNEENRKDGCKPTYSKFNTNFPPRLNYPGVNENSAGQPQGSQPQKHRGTGDVWYWSRK